MIQDLIFSKFKVFYAVFYIAELLRNMGFSFQEARFESAHLNEIKRKEWILKRWPKLLNEAKKLGAYILFGDEASFPQWGTLNYTWVKKGAIPVLRTSGSRKGYNVFGLIEYLSGKFFCQAQEEKLDWSSYIHFLEEVLEKTKKPLFLIQDNAGYHTSAELKRFFEDHTERLRVFELPAYSPDYKAIEMLWEKLKKFEIFIIYFLERYTSER